MEDKNTILTVAIVLAVLILFSVSLFPSIIFSQFGGMHYGSPYMCRMMGGIWCYWPSYGISSLISILVLIVLILLIILIAKQLNSQNKRRKK